MTYYTIIPSETIFQESSVTNTEVETVFMQDGIIFSGLPLSPNSVQVSRIISTDPKDFLQKKIIPGQVMFLK